MSSYDKENEDYVASLPLKDLCCDDCGKIVAPIGTPHDYDEDQDVICNLCQIRTKPISVKVTHSINAEQLNDLLACAFEGGSNYWYTELQVHKYPNGKSAKDFEYFHLEVPLCVNGIIKFKDKEWEFTKSCEANEDVACIDGYYYLHLPKIKRGLQALADDYPFHWNNIITENTDADTGDAFLQCCIFGRVIYG